MLKLKLQYFGHMIRRADSLEKILMLRLGPEEKRGQQLSKNNNSASQVELEVKKLPASA